MQGGGWSTPILSHNSGLVTAAYALMVAHWRDGCQQAPAFVPWQEILLPQAGSLVLLHRLPAGSGRSGAGVPSPCSSRPGPKMRGRR